MILMSNTQVNRDVIVKTIHMFLGYDVILKSMLPMSNTIGALHNIPWQLSIETSIQTVIDKDVKTPVECESVKLN